MGDPLAVEAEGFAALHGGEVADDGDDLALVVGEELGDRVVVFLVRVDHPFQGALQLLKVFRRGHGAEASRGGCAASKISQGFPLEALGGGRGIEGCALGGEEDLDHFGGAFSGAEVLQKGSLLGEHADPSEAAEVEAVILAAEEEEKIGGFVVRRTELDGLQGAADDEKGALEEPWVMMPRMRDCETAGKARGTERFALEETVDESLCVVEQAGLFGHGNEVAQDGGLGPRGKGGGNARIVDERGNFKGTRRNFGCGRAYPGVVGSDAITFHPEDALGGPCVDFGGTKDGAITAHLERDIAIANEGSNIVFVQVQV